MERIHRRMQKGPEAEAQPHCSSNKRISTARNTAGTRDKALLDQKQRLGISKGFLGIDWPILDSGSVKPEILSSACSARPGIRLMVQVLE